MKKKLDINDIKKILPHRYPFLLIDRVEEISAKHVRAFKNVTANEPFFNGHFPDLPIMPGVLQIEAMAQAAGLVLSEISDFDLTREIAVLAGVDDAKFRRMVIPGDQLVLEAELQNRKRNLVKLKARASVGGELASEAIISLVIKTLN
jgi:3-hydroxyacyl-[acyl-carrier-protein] dehydratase